MYTFLLRGLTLDPTIPPPKKKGRGEEQTRKQWPVKQNNIGLVYSHQIAQESIFLRDPWVTIRKH